MKYNLHLIIACSLVSVQFLFSQIPNNGFENWTSKGTYDLPYGWSTLNNSTANATVFTASKGTPGNPGSSYLKLTSRTVNNMVVGGIAVGGKLDSMTMMPISGFSFTQAPLTFTGKWQHMIYGSSQGSILVSLTKWNPQLNQRKTIATASVTLSGMAMSWANFGMNLVYTDSIYPDSCIIVLKSSGSAPTNNDYLWVDNLAFIGSLTMPPPPPPPNLVGLKVNQANQILFTTYPVPAQDYFIVSYYTKVSDQIKIKLEDVSGKILKEFEPAVSTDGINSLNIETNTLSKGIYYITFKNGNAISSKKIVIE